MRRILIGAAIVLVAVLCSRCYTLLEHPEVASDGYEVPKSCTDCHIAHYGDPYYHWPFHYYDPPVSSWVYERRFYGRSVYSVTYHHRYRYYSSYPWWWNSRSYTPESRSYTYPKSQSPVKPKPLKRNWARRSDFDRPVTEFGLRQRETSSGLARPKDSLPRFEGSRSAPADKSVSPTGEPSTPKKVEDDDDDDQKKEKRSGRREGMR